MDNLELEYDLIEQQDDNIISSDDIQHDILNLVKLAENEHLCTHTLEHFFENPIVLELYENFNLSARNIFNYINGNKNYMNVMFKLIQCFRCQYGLDKRLLSYCLLDILSEYDAIMANELFSCFVKNIGCWKDLKYFYYFCYKIGKENNSSVIEYSIKLANEELRLNPSSNVAKWIPREKTKYKKLYDRLVLNYFEDSDYFKYCQTSEQKYKAMNKAKMEYRKILSQLNRQLDTVQIKQCSKQWQKIDPKTQTKGTLELQMNAFLNLSRNSNKIRHETCDRIICSQNFIDNNNVKFEQDKPEKIETYYELIKLMNAVQLKTSFSE